MLQKKQRIKHWYHRKDKLNRFMQADLVSNGCMLMFFRDFRNVVMKNDQHSTTPSRKNKEFIKTCFDWTKLLSDERIVVIGPKDLEIKGMF